VELPNEYKFVKAVDHRCYYYLQNPFGEKILCVFVKITGNENCAYSTIINTNPANLASDCESDTNDKS